MTGTELSTLIGKKTSTNTTTFTEADRLIYVNIFIKEIASMIVEKNNGMFLVPATFNLVADQREYGLPDDLLNRMHKVTFKFASGDARFPSTYKKDYHGSETESEIVAQFSNAKGDFAHTIRRRAILLLSGTIINVTGGGRLWYHAYPADLANLTGSTDLSVDPSTTTFGFPRQFHELLARRVSIEYKGSKAKPIPLNRHERNYENDLQTQLVAVASIDNSAEIIGDLPPAKDLGDDGFDY